MLINGPRVGQWVMFGDKFEIGKVQKVYRQYRYGPARRTGPVVKVKVHDEWYPVEKTRVLSPKAAKASTKDLY